ncbi:hypothetical protein GCM10010521_10960 [Streptomyces rameus]|uniref:Uncharacterized protein n=1 Tax=Streptomyces rameus TaxID=68261 RepID=A0ABP6MU25_9ACTN
MSLLDVRVPAVLPRIDRNPIHHGTLGAVRSLGGAGVEVHVVAAPRRITARIARPAVLVPMDDASAVAAGRRRAEPAPAHLLPRQPAPRPGQARRPSPPDLLPGLLPEPLPDLPQGLPLGATDDEKASSC